MAKKQSKAMISSHHFAWSRNIKEPHATTEQKLTFITFIFSSVWYCFLRLLSMIIQFAGCFWGKA